MRHRRRAVAGLAIGAAGTVDSNTCSGIAQRTWDFSQILEPFTG